MPPRIQQRPKAAFLFSPAILATLAISCAENSYAAEAGFGIYTLGAKGPSAGIIPPPGTYVVSQHFVYSGEYSGPVSLAPGPPVKADVNIDLSFNNVSAVWIFPYDVFGGHLGIGATLPVGHVGVSLKTSAGQIADSRISVGDPLFGAFIGWHQGDVHWNLGATVVAPIGDYDSQRLSNLSLNRPALDLYGAATWTERSLGLEVSLALGVTLNGENAATLYRTGSEFHAEWALMKQLSSQFSLGLVGYHYDQFTGDSGPGAGLGDFEGRATAIGGAASYSFAVEDTLVSVRLHALKELKVRNRFEGTPVFVTVIIATGP